MTKRASASPPAYRPQYEAIAERLAILIAQQQWPVGAKLPTEHQLCEQFGISRTIIREALKVLATAGLVEVRKGVGTYVADGATAPKRFLYDYALLTDPQRMDDFMTFRCMLETNAARLAASEITVAELRHIQDLVRQNAAYAAEGDGVHYLATDDAFHSAIAAATHNAYLIESIERVLHLQRWAMTILRDKLPDHLHQGAGFHQAVCVALSQGQAEEAAAAMHAHIMTIRDIYQSEIRQRLLATTDAVSADA